MIPGLPYKLEVFLISNNGIYLRDHQGTEVILPEAEKPENITEGEKILVYVYKDADGRLLGTTKKPYVLLNETAVLEVRAVTKHGAFADWGPDKDLFIPFKEQPEDMEAGKKYLIHMYLDAETNRLAGSGYIYKFLGNDRLSVKEGEEVELLVAYKSDLGQNVIVNQKHQGLIYENEIFQKIRPGQQLKGFVAKIREGNKLDIRLQKEGVEGIRDNAAEILQMLEAAGGFLPLHDKSSPEQIYDIAGMSKKLFKKAIGSLYKQQKITLEKDGIRLV